MKSSTFIARLILGVTFLLACLRCLGQESIFCQRHSIVGLEAVHDRAERLMSAQTTNDPQKSEFIYRSKDINYTHNQIIYTKVRSIR